MECNQLAKDLAVDGWTLINLKDLSTNKSWTWDESDRIGYGRDACLRLEKCVDFKKDLWFEL